jgi:hypothetical protein
MHHLKFVIPAFAGMTNFSGNKAIIVGHYLKFSAYALARGH